MKSSWALCCSKVNVRRSAEPICDLKNLQPSSRVKKATGECHGLQLARLLRSAKKVGGVSKAECCRKVHLKQIYWPLSGSTSPLSGKDAFLFPFMLERELEDGDFFLKCKSSLGNNSRRLVINTMYSMFTMPSSEDSFGDTTNVMSYSLLSRRMSYVLVSEYLSCVRTRSVPNNKCCVFSNGLDSRGSVWKS